MIDPKVLDELAKSIENYDDDPDNVMNTWFIAKEIKYAADTIRVLTHEVELLKLDLDDEKAGHNFAIAHSHEIEKEIIKRKKAEEERDNFKFNYTQALSDLRVQKENYEQKLNIACSLLKEATIYLNTNFGEEANLINYIDEFLLNKEG